VFGHCTSEPVGEIGVNGMEGEERHERSVKVFDLGLLPASGVSDLLLGEALGGSLGFEVGTNAFNCGRRRPDSP
jgi:hypothetical protein